MLSHLLRALSFLLSCKLQISRCEVEGQAVSWIRQAEGVARAGRKNTFVDLNCPCQGLLQRRPVPPTPSRA